MTLGALKPGIAPASVLPLAAQAARELATVEASDVGVVAGTARATVRFSAEAAELAGQIGRHVAEVTATVVDVLDVRITERVGGRWYTVQP
jgi:hypothetical protein